MHELIFLFIDTKWLIYWIRFLMPSINPWHYVCMPYIFVYKLIWYIGRRLVYCHEIINLLNQFLKPNVDPRNSHYVCISYIFVYKSILCIFRSLIYRLEYINRGKDGIIYSRGVWNALFFIGCYWRTDVYKNGRSPALLIFFFFCFAIKEAAWLFQSHAGGFCRSRYDAKITRNR